MRGAFVTLLGADAPLFVASSLGSGRGALGASLLRTRTGNVEVTAAALVPAQPEKQARAVTATKHSTRSSVMAAEQSRRSVPTRPNLSPLP